MTNAGSNANGNAHGMGARAGIFGAGSLLGRELADELKESPLAAMDLVLLDEAEASGQMTAVGDEAAFLQQVEDTALEGMEFAFFAGRVAAERHWRQAQEAGASLVDLSFALEHEAGMVVRSPWVSGLLGDGLDLEAAGVISAHPATVMLALALARLQGKVEVTRATATVLEPASEHGREAMDELHQQTVSLLSFQNLPREQYDAQVAFNLLPSAGAAAKVRLAEGEGRILRHYAALSQGRLPELDLQLIQAPVFHGYSASVMLELKGEATQEQVVSALRGEHVEIAEESDPPTNVSAAGQEKVLVRVRPESDAPMTRFWLWLAADNLKLAARNGIACALELRRLRPQAKVQ